MGPLKDKAQIRRLRRKLLGWFDRCQRDMPWRKTRDPYAIWLSEIMLQQTQVATVIPYYERFLASFPTVQVLAAADLDDVLKLWAGLGYYARGRNLHRAAQMVVSDFGGRFPETVEQLKRLPGVGAYTAAAVASIAFDFPAATVDGNVIRVVSRLLDSHLDVGSRQGCAVVEAAADRLLMKGCPQKRPRFGDFNQAMMELGAMVCLPNQAAQCGECPLRSECRANAAGTVADLPIKAAKVAVKSEIHVVAAVERSGRWLIVQRPEEGLWGGLWELPTEVLPVGKKARADLAAAAKSLAERMSGETYQGTPSQFCDFEHKLSHRTIRFVGFSFQEGKTKRKGREDRKKRAERTGGQKKEHTTQWLPIDGLEAVGMSKAMRRAIECL